MKIAIASSGLGHVFRGMEGWAEDLAQELYKRGIDITLFRGSGPKNNKYDVRIPCIKRSSILARLLSKLNKFGGWRIGLGSSGQIEAWSFGILLLWYIRNKYDVLHIKQGNLATFLHLAERLRLIKVPFILGNGQIVSPVFISKFKYVQFLSQYDKNEMEKVLGKHPCWTAIPNFVDVEKFKPLPKHSCKADLGINRKKRVILIVAAIKIYHKRIDYFITEMKKLLDMSDKPLHIIIAGSYDPDTPVLLKMGKHLLGNNFSSFINIPKTEMPKIYNAADLFVLTSLKEAHPNVLLEAMACGLPSIHSTYPVLKWITGDSGESCDLSRDGELAKLILKLILNDKIIQKKSVIARQRVLEMFSKEKVVSQIIEMYNKIYTGLN